MRFMGSIRRLETRDAAAFRALRLDGLARHPEAFGASWESEAEQPLEWFGATLKTHALFGAPDGDGLVGAAGLFMPDSPKLRNKGTLWGAYVRPDARGKEIGTALISAVIDHATSRVEDLNLSVGATNTRAIRRYEAAGFKPYGLETRALKVGEQYYAEVLMILNLNQSG
ncbi:hypothetical protein ASF60_03445 [Methylobacterium sp. Leaf113]|nr:hypothetical protein ASF60_03445 [Methylobacterium sp. Leaf113]